MSEHYSTFVSPIDKGRAIYAIKLGDESGATFLLNEMDRLEQLVKAYEIVLNSTHRVIENPHLKRPKSYEPAADPRNC